MMALTDVLQLRFLIIPPNKTGNHGILREANNIIYIQISDILLRNTQLIMFIYQAPSLEVIK